MNGLAATDACFITCVTAGASNYQSLAKVGEDRCRSCKLALHMHVLSLLHLEVKLELLGYLVCISAVIFPAPVVLALSLSHVDA